MTDITYSRPAAEDDDAQALAAALEMPIPVNNGAWTVEEVDYMLRLIDAFKAGFLELKNGTTLRGFLAKMLSCKAKRVSKRFEGLSNNKIGKLIKAVALSFSTCI